MQECRYVQLIYAYSIDLPATIPNWVARVNCILLSAYLSMWRHNNFLNNHLMTYLIHIVDIRFTTDVPSYEMYGWYSLLMFISYRVSFNATTAKYVPYRSLSSFFDLARKKQIFISRNVKGNICLQGCFRCYSIKAQM